MNTEQDVINAEEVEIINEPAFNPLTQESVNEKSYAKANISSKGIDPNAPIAEPTFTPPPIQTDEQQQPRKAPPPPVNPQINELNPKEKKNAATVAANMVLSGYKMINTLANQAVQISENAQKKLVKKNQIDLRVPLQLAQGVIPLGDFIEAYNQESSDSFTVSQEFEDEILPPLIREFEKRGIGASDKDMILFCVGKDLAFKLPRFIQLLKVRKEMINQMIEVTDAYRASVAGSMPQTPPPPPINNDVPPTKSETAAYYAEELPLEDKIPQPTSNSDASVIYQSEPKPKRKYKKREKKEDKIDFSDGE